MPPHSELDADLLQRLKWTDIRDEIQRKVCEEADRCRRIGHLLPRWSDEFEDPNAISDTASDAYKDDDGEPYPYRVPAQPTLVSAEIECRFRIGPEQFGDRAVAFALAARAAHQVGLAEDLVLFWGEKLKPPDPSNSRYPHVRYQYLEKQEKYIYHPDRQKIPKVDPEVILESIQDGIRELQKVGQFGEYCVIVSRDLYEAAFQPRAIPSLGGDPPWYAPINQIRPLLREGGFLYSPMAEPCTGAIFSLGGGAIGIAVPREAHLAYIGMDRDVILSVKERIRLLIKEPDAMRLLELPRCRKEPHLSVTFHPATVMSGETAFFRVRTNFPGERRRKKVTLRLTGDHVLTFDPAPPREDGAYTLNLAAPRGYLYLNATTAAELRQKEVVKVEAECAGEKEKQNAELEILPAPQPEVEER